MNSIITTATGNSTLTMSSREIAEICDARHNDVVETIVRLFDQGVLRESRKTTRTYRPEGGGRPTEVYDLTKRDTLVVVSGYNADVRAKIIDRWLELEGRPQPKHEIPQTLGEALRLAAAENDMRLAAESKVAALAPKAEALDRISTADGTYGLYEAAKILQVNPQKLVKWMGSNRWIYKRTGGKNWLARQEKINAGYLWHKVRTYTDPNGEEKTRDEVKVLAKGLTKLAQVVPGAVIDRGIVPEESRSLSSIAGSATEFRMDAIAMDVAFRAMLVIASGLGNGKPSGTTEFMREKAKTAARAVMQIWGDLERLEQRALV